jgi:hypothetical protein
MLGKLYSMWTGKIAKKPSLGRIKAQTDSFLPSFSIFDGEWIPLPYTESAFLN